VADDGTVEEMSQAKAISLRFGIMAVVVLVAALSFEFLGSVESIVGAVCSMSSSMLLPAFFFLRYTVKHVYDTCVWCGGKLLMHWLDSTERIASAVCPVRSSGMLSAFFLKSSYATYSWYPIGVIATCRVGYS